MYYSFGLFLRCSFAGMLVWPALVWATIPSPSTLYGELLNSKRSLASVVVRQEINLSARAGREGIRGQQILIVRFPGKNESGALQWVRQFKQVRWIEIVGSEGRFVFYRGNSKQVRPNDRSGLPSTTLLEALLLSRFSNELSRWLSTIGVQTSRFAHEYINRQLFYILGNFESSVPENSTLRLELGTGRQLNDFFKEGIRSQLLIEKSDHSRKEPRPIRPHSIVYPVGGAGFAELYDYESSDMQSDQQRSSLPWFPNRYRMLKDLGFSLDAEMTSMDVNVSLTGASFDPKKLQEKTRIGSKEQAKVARILELLDAIWSGI